MTTWTVGIRALDDTDIDEWVTVTDAVAHVYWFENGVVIQTDPTGFGDFRTERVVPWARVLDYHKGEARAAQSAALPEGPGGAGVEGPAE